MSRLKSYKVAVTLQIVCLRKKTVMDAAPQTIWTIGHSTRTADEFLALLVEQQIKILVDVRHFPGSRRYPHFNKENLSSLLNAGGIRYEHIVELGGRRPPLPDSHNTVWRNASFRGYADYMETAAFHGGIKRLLAIAIQAPTAIMCSEAVWWRCHRSMIADYLKAKGIGVLHILGTRQLQSHPYTAAARVIDGEVVYRSS
jgi:uncharacterized protein (DUF488 family)